MIILWICVVGAIVFLAALYGGVAWYYKMPVSSIFFTGVRKGISFIETSTNTTLFAPTPPAATKNISTKPLSIIKTTLSNGVIRYVLYGKFVTPLTKEENSLHGEFVVDGDPGASHVAVIVSPKIGPVLLGSSNGTIEGETLWKEKTLEEVQKTVEINAPAQIWWTLPPASPQRQDQILTDILDQANEKPQNLQGLQLTVQAVGVLAN